MYYKEKKKLNAANLDKAESRLEIFAVRTCTASNFTEILLSHPDVFIEPGSIHGYLDLVKRVIRIDFNKGFVNSQDSEEFS